MREKVKVLKHHTHFLTDFQPVLFIVVKRGAVNGIEPESISSSPFKHLRNLDFPDPEGPMITTTSLRRIFVEKFFSATTPLSKVLSIPSM